MKSFKIFFYLSISAILFGLSFPGMVFKEGGGVFAWVAVAGLFFALDKMNTESAFVWGIFYGALSYGLLTFWLWNYSFFMLVLSVLFYGLCYALVFALMKMPEKGLGRWKTLYRVLLLTTFDFIKTKGFLGFSYGVMGYSQWKNPLLIQIADITGVYGVSFVIFLANGALYEVIKLVKDYKKSLHPLETKKIRKEALLMPVSLAALFVLCLGTCLVYGGARIKSIKKETSILPVKDFILVQNNENPREDGIQVYANNINTLMKLTDEALSLYPEADYVVWPETAVAPSIIYQYNHGKDSRRVSVVNSLLKYMDSKNAGFIIGNFHAEYMEGTNVTKDYNSVLFFTPGKNVIPPEPERYYKQHLVPLSESFPWGKYLPKLNKFLIDLGASFWNRGTECNVFTHGDLCFGTPVCFEDTFPDLCRRFTKKGAGCFVNVTNDSWSRSLACQNQHLSMALFRSVENRIPTVRSATSGQTCSISRWGRVEKCAHPFTESFIKCSVPVVKNLKNSTFYSLFGDVFSYIITILYTVLLLIGLIKGILEIWQNK